MKGLTSRGRWPGIRLLAILPMLMLVFNINGNRAFAEEATPQLPVLLLNGAIYPQHFDAAGLPASFRVDGYPADITALYILQCNGSIRETWVNDIGNIGGQVRGYLPYNALIVALDGSARAKLQELQFVEWSSLYQPYFKIAPALQLRLVQGGEDVVLVEVFSQRFLPDTLSSLSQLGIEVLGSEADQWCGIIAARLRMDMVKEVAALAGVEWMEISTKGTLCGAVLPAGETSSGGNILAAPADSTSEKIALTDTGIGTGGAQGIPPILADSVAGLYSSRQDSGADLDGHGSAVAGVLADVQALYEGSQARPQNSIIAYATDYGISSPARPLSLYSMLESGYALGARIHLSGSVPEGRESLGAYGIYASQRDAFVWSNPTMSLVEAAGNEGTDANGDGVVDKGSLIGGAVAKDAITVGGSESPKEKTGGGDALDYTRLQNYFAGRFPSSPIKNDSSVGDQSGMAAFSSRGPTCDGRIKPDIVAPATYILSAASGGTQSAPGIESAEPGYVRAYGTGMAAAQVAREVADMRRLLISKYGSEPSAALLKAFLVNGAADMAPGQYGGGATQEIPTSPNVVEGWGRLDMETSGNETSWIKVLEDSEGLRLGESRVFKIEVATAKSLHVTLAWSDYPSLPEARLQLVNDLDLKVTDTEGNIIYPNGRNSRDPLNNVERIDIDVSGKPGVYSLEVSGWNVPLSPQPFALVAQAF